MSHPELSGRSRAGSRRTALVSGASIAGPALAYWLNRRGFAVTVVEKAATLRGGGYPIDIRGPALDVVRRMGLLPRLRDSHIDLGRLTFLDRDGDEITSLRPHLVTGGVAGRDLEVPRGDLTAALHSSVQDDVELMFDDSIETLSQSGTGVDVTFHGGSQRTFDVVVGADGLHSHTRTLVFGPETPFHRHLGYCFAGFSMPNTLGLSHESVLWNTPGRAAALYAAADSNEVHALLTFSHPDPPSDAFRRPAAQRDLVSEVFADAGWEVPRMLGAMRAADDLFFDAVSQVHMPRWSEGRVALVGDAAHAPSFLTGQGSSLALVGAYMLADSLADREHGAGFADYEARTRGFVAANQGLVGTGDATMCPVTEHSLTLRNTRLRNLHAMPAAEGRPEHSALKLPRLDPLG